MTIETKRKIIWWVKRVLNYCEYADKYPYLVVDKKSIINVRSEHMYPAHEMLMISEDQIHYAANAQLISELEKNRLIKYSKICIDDHVRVIAELNVLMS